VLADIADSSVALILTDPPYGTKAEPLYRWLAAFAARVLIPGGSLICYTGNVGHGRRMRTFAAHLVEQPQLVMLHTTSQNLHGSNAHIRADHKPVLHYTKGPRRRVTHGVGPLLPTVLRTGGKDKRLHEWAQGDGGTVPLIDTLTEPGELVVEPFCGPGTWGRIVHALGRRWIGCDIVRGGAPRVALAGISAGD
jgi:hypothetical protein